MGWTPEAEYARSGDVHIAYQVVGRGDRDLVLDYGYLTHFEALWEDPSFAMFVERLSSFSRVILFDRRGHGLSDPLDFGEGLLLEQRMDDVRALMAAVGSERALLMATDVGGRMAALFAATHPELVSGLILYGTMAKIGWEPDYPIGVVPEVFEAFISEIEQGWRNGSSLNFVAPSLAYDERYKKFWARFQRAAMSPGEMVALLRLDWQDDIRGVLESINVPTLVLHRKGDLLVGVDHGRYLAEHIPGATLVELDGSDHLPWVGDFDSIVDEVEDFVTGVRHGPGPHRVLAAVMFTDIVGSTERVAERGDAHWRTLLDRHDALVRRQVDRFRGREVNTTGDGMMAAFDGPARALQCALSTIESTRRLGLDVRIGVHVGECEQRGEDLAGLAVHIAARIMSLAAPGEVLASSTVRDLTAGSGFEFSDRGSHELKGAPGEWRLAAVSPAVG